MKADVKKLLANNGVELAGYVAMMRCIAAGLLKKNGSRLGKDSILPDHKTMLRKFRKQPKDIQRFVMAQIKPISSPPKCPNCGHYLD